jgi:hypothetical protein
MLALAGYLPTRSLLLLSYQLKTVKEEFTGEGGEDMKKPYTSPRLTKWGTVTDLTKTGKTNEGGDAKVGSVASEGV